MPNQPLILRAATKVEKRLERGGVIEDPGGVLTDTRYIIVYIADGFPERRHKLTTRMGGEPLEDGREVTDHVRAAPASITLQGSVSDMHGGQLTTVAWQAIKALHKASEPVRVTTEWDTIAEMVIASAEAFTVGRGLEFEMELREIIRVSTTGVPSTPPEYQSGNATGRSGLTSRGRATLHRSVEREPLDSERQINAADNKTLIDLNAEPAAAF